MSSHRQPAPPQLDDKAVADLVDHANRQVAYNDLSEVGRELNKRIHPWSRKWVFDSKMGKAYLMFLIGIGLWLGIPQVRQHNRNKEIRESAKPVLMQRVLSLCATRPGCKASNALVERCIDGAWFLVDSRCRGRRSVNCNPEVAGFKPHILATCMNGHQKRHTFDTEDFTGLF